MAQQVAAKNDKFSKGARTSSAFTLLFLSSSNLKKYPAGKENEVINGMIQNKYDRRFVFSKWSDVYFENQDKLLQRSSNDGGITDLRDYYSHSSSPIESLQYSYASCTKEENISDDGTAKRIFEELVSNHDNPEVNLIILTEEDSSGSKIAEKLFTLINKSQDKKVNCLWGGETFGIIEAEPKEVGENLYRKPIFVGIRMFHSTLKFWSLIVDFRQFEREIIEFKKHVQLKRHSLGFVSGRSTMIRQEMISNPTGLAVGNSSIVKSSDFVDVVKAHFPNTPFMGGFNLNLTEIYGCNSIKNDEGVIKNRLAVSLMIITHD